MEIKKCAYAMWNDLGIAQFTHGDVDRISYHGSSSALKDGRLRIQEVSDSGSVNTVLAINSSEDLLFLCDGDILLGAKQNRCVNLSVLLAPNSETPISVSCVEAHRWKSSEPVFRKADYSTPMSIRLQMHSNRVEALSDRSNSRRSELVDQSAVWSNVEALLREHRVYSRTSALTDAMDQQVDKADSLLNHIPVHEEASGYALFIHGDLKIIEAFHRRDIFAEHLRQVLRGVMTDCISDKKVLKSEMTEEQVWGEIASRIGQLEEAGFVEFPAAGLGEHHSALTKVSSVSLLRYKNASIHLSLAARDAHAPFTLI